jgi:hypothetical protein
MDARTYTLMVGWYHPARLLRGIKLTVVVNNRFTRLAVAVRRSQIFNLPFALLVPVPVLFILLCHVILHRPVNYTDLARVLWFFTVVSVIFSALAENWAHGLRAYREIIIYLDKLHAASWIRTAGALIWHFLLLRLRGVLLVGKHGAHFVFNDVLQSQSNLLIASHVWNHRSLANLIAPCVHQHLFLSVLNV